MKKIFCNVISSKGIKTHVMSQVYMERTFVEHLSCATAGYEYLIFMWHKPCSVILQKLLMSDCWVCSMKCGSCRLFRLKQTAKRIKQCLLVYLHLYPHFYLTVSLTALSLIDIQFWHILGEGYFVTWKSNLKEFSPNTLQRRSQYFH